jgi:SAM-dependent methyltransferase
MTSDPMDRWSAALAARAIPPEILGAAPESPWAYPTEPFRARAARAIAEPPTPTTLRAKEALPAGGTLLDVGCGSGATSLPLAPEAGRLIGVDSSAAMLETFREAAEATGAQVTTVEGIWPDAASSTPRCDVVVCGHVLYNVAALEPFARALDGHAARRVVIEITERHPLAWMNDLWLRFHGVRFSDGPSADLAQEALDSLGLGVHREDRDGSRGHGGFAGRDGAIALVRRRLCLEASRDEDLAEALGDRLQEADGRWSAGPVAQRVITLWWDPPG